VGKIIQSKVYLDLEKLKEKKKNVKSNFFSLFDLRKLKGKKCKENLYYYEGNFFFLEYERKMKEKFILNHLLK